MTHLTNKIISFILATSILMVTFIYFPMTVYATHGGGGGSDHDSKFPERFAQITSWNEKSNFEKWNIVFDLTLANLGCVKNFNFAQILENQTAFKDYVENNNVDDLISVSDDNLVIPADLAALIKQALEEYAASVLPFKIENTYRLDAIPASTFNSKEAYNIFKTYCTSHEIVLANPQGSYFNLGDITPYIKEGGGFVKYSGQFVVYNANWKLQSIPIDRYTEKRNSDGSYTIELQENYGSTQWIGHYNPDKIKFNEYGQQNFIVTHDGGRIRVFNSAAEFMDYNAGQRKVYFGSDFYDKETGAIKVSYDELMDYMDGKYDKLIEDLKDLIGDNPGLSEEELEKLVDKLLGRIGEIGDNQQETNGILSGIAASLSGYFSSVLAKLDEILSAIEALVWIEADNKLEGDKSDLFDLIDAIWKNPQEGSQEAADTLTSSFSEIATGITKKFPFSIPWDIHALFTIFTGTPPPGEARYRTVTLGTAPFTIDPADIRQDGHEAPYFVLPLVVESYGISEAVVIDLKDFKTVSTLSRGLLSALFGVFLIKFTIRIIELFKGGAGD